MSVNEEQLLEALLQLEASVQSMATAEVKPNLLPLFQRIDELVRALPPDSDSQLQHYLQKRSYHKARLWLQGRDSENVLGRCGHV